MSDDGHHEAISYFMRSIGENYTFVSTDPNNNGPGALINKCNNEAFKRANTVLYIENDMFLHKDLHVIDYMEDMESGNIGCVNFRYMLPKGMCSYKPFKPGKIQYVYHIPSSKDSTFTVFGSTMYSRKYYDLMGPVSEGAFGTELDPEAVMDRRYLKLFSDGTLFKNRCLMVIDTKHLTETYNSDDAPFYHVGINCQHKPGCSWNRNLLRKEYHMFSDENLDRDFRNIFKNKGITPNGK
jgi:hypothetical protein